MKKRIIRVISLVMLLVLFATSNFGFIINANAATYVYSSLKDLPKAVLDNFIKTLEYNKIVPLTKYNGTYCVKLRVNNNYYYLKETALLGKYTSASDTLAFCKASKSLTTGFISEADANDSAYVIKRSPYNSKQSRVYLTRVDNTWGEDGTDAIIIRGEVTASLAFDYCAYSHQITIVEKEYNSMLIKPTYSLDLNNRYNPKMGIYFNSLKGDVVGIPNSSKKTIDAKTLVTVGYTVGKMIVTKDIKKAVLTVLNWSYNYIKNSDYKATKSSYYSIYGDTGISLRKDGKYVYSVKATSPIYLGRKGDYYQIRIGVYTDLRNTRTYFALGKSFTADLGLGCISTDARYPSFS